MRNGDHRQIDVETDSLRGEIQMKQVYRIPINKLPQKIGNNVELIFISRHPIQGSIQPNQWPDCDCFLLLLGGRRWSKSGEYGVNPEPM
ncbi:hypothetical protein RsS62_06100 [Rhizobium dioscoreae]|nr:hypothetical protein RsS62_06100 [Rhizobium dioscoreae]